MSALISVYDKTGIADFAARLVDLGHEIISTGGTLRALEEAGVPVRSVVEITGFPEILDGRVKTLHPAVHAGVLARRDDPAHVEILEELGIAPIDVVAVNLYPFAATLAKGLSHAENVEQIDIGGPTMIRAAAKNAEHVMVVVDPADYDRVAAALEGEEPADLRAELAATAFAHTAGYDALIAAYYAGRGGDLLPERLALPLTLASEVRYGENPHQTTAAFYRFGPPELPAFGLAGAEQLHGQQLSYNNYLDADAGWNLVTDFDEPTVAAIKHGNPCGLAVGGDDLAAIYQRTFACDPVSIFGGIVATNRTLDLAMATAMRGTLLDIVIAPDYEVEALALLKKRRRTRILRIPLELRDPANVVPALADLKVRSVAGGVLVQEADRLPDNDLTFEVVSKRKPTAEQERDLRFAWRAIKHVKSNAIVLARGMDLIGIGTGQMSRVDSVHMSIYRAGDRAAGSVLASDAFFPFADGAEMALEAGIEALIEPGGSVRDEEVIEAVDKADAVLVFTGGERHFRH
jgi:phosphoribosylaminoimidazolecarboxamide formyltransferase / IMP cyclohydrolase